MADWPPKKNVAFTFRVPGLVSQANPTIFQVNPTLAVGDVKVSLNGGTFTNITTLPTVIGSLQEVSIALSQSEMNFDEVVVFFHDVAGAEWCDWGVTIFPVTRQIVDLSYPATSGRSMVVDANGRLDISLVEGVDATDNIADAVLDRAITEPSAIFTWPASLRQIIRFLGVATRNKRTTTNTADVVRNDADNATVATSTLSDDGTTFTRGKYS